MFEAPDPCKPIRIWIDGFCFNLPINNQASSGELKRRKLADDKYEGKFTEDNHLPIVTDDNEKLSFSFQLPYLYCLALKQGDVLDTRNLSQKTNTSISFPKLGKDGKMEIKGETKENIMEALDEIHTAVGKIRHKKAPLQFLSLRCSSEDIKNNFERFKSEILAEKEMKGMEESIFQRALKLHLTIDVLVLLDKNEKNEAVAALEQYNESIMKPLLEKTGPLKILVSGVECMNNKYENVHVLYAKAKLVNETEEISLQKIANNLSNFFYERGLLKSYQENVKLHCTLINTKYRQESSSPKKKWNKRKSFDARAIMEKYKDFEFGQCDFNEIHLSLMSSTTADGYYENLSSVKFV